VFLFSGQGSLSERAPKTCFDKFPEVQGVAFGNPAKAISRRSVWCASIEC
jgi:hypothetical protein